MRGSTPLQRATWLAATLGPFRPAELLKKVAEGAEKCAALAKELAALCSEVVLEGEVLWTLNSNPRRRALLEMQRRGVIGPRGLHKFIARLAVRPKDHFGRYLRDALTNAAQVEWDKAEIDAQYAAFEFVGRAKVGATPERARELAGVFDQLSQQAVAESSLAQTIGPVFVGRGKELNALRQFAQEGWVSEPSYTGNLPARTSVTLSTPTVLVSGVSGAGKSAMIATLVGRLRSESSGVAATAILDFDRPQLTNLDRVHLTLEVIRQIPLSHPDLAKPLLELRRTAFNEFTDVELASTSNNISFRRDSRALFAIHSRLEKILCGRNLVSKPFVVIVDTFEEMLTLGDQFAEAVYRWCDDLRNDAGLTNLRVIVSGRALPTARELAEPDSEVPNWVAERAVPNVVAEIPLGDLTLDDAVDALERCQVDAPIRRSLAELFGSNALVLRLLGDYIVKHGADVAQDLLRGSESPNFNLFRAEEAQRLLYSRILDRVRGEADVKALAGPGLILRVVTPGIIREVLALPCGLDEISPERARELFEKLAREVWLVKRIDERVIMHRRDVRSLVRPLVGESDRAGARGLSASQIAEIHRAAIRHHSGERDPDIAPATARDERVYHRLFVEPEAGYQSPDLPFALPNLRQDIADFPIATRARLKQMMMQPLSPEEMFSLDQQSRRKYELDIAALEARNVGLSELRRPPHPMVIQLATPGSSSPPISRELENDSIAAFARGKFAELARVCGDLLDAFVDQAVGRSLGRLQADLTNHPTWLAALATLGLTAGERRIAPGTEWLEWFCGRIQQHWDRFASYELSDRSGFRVTHYLIAVAILLNRGRVPDACVTQLLKMLERNGERRIRFEVTSIAALRIFQLLSTGLSHSTLELQPKAVELSCLQYFAGLLESSALPVRSMARAQGAWQVRMQRVQAAVQEVTRSQPSLSSTAALSEVERALGDQKIDLYGWRQRKETAAEGRQKPGDSVPSGTILHGMFPELQSPLLLALRERFTDSNELAGVLRRLKHVSPLWPRDLLRRDREYEPALRLTDTRLATLCHYADRFGALPLLWRDADRRSLARRVGLVYSRYFQIIGHTWGV